VPDEPSIPLPPPPRGELYERLRLLRHDPRAGAVLLVLCACAAGVYWFRTGIAAARPSVPPAVAGTRAPQPSSTSTATTSPASTVVVHVAGAVRRPGVVTLRSTSRVVDAIDAAGGPKPTADLDRLNLAAKLADGERIAVPLRGQPAPALDPGASTVDPATTDGSPTPDAPVDLNTATEAQLEALPGIGPTLAQAIIAERDRAGGFRSVDDLRKVRGIGDARFAQLRPLVSV
jgi:competence protein ComEA